MFGQLNINDSIIQIQPLVGPNAHWFHSDHNQCAALFCIGEQRGFISLSRSVMNGLVNVMWKYRCGAPAGVFVESLVASSRV